MTPRRPSENLGHVVRVMLGTLVLVALATAAIAQTTLAAGRGPRSLFAAASRDVTWLVRPSVIDKSETSFDVLRRASAPTSAPAVVSVTDGQWTRVALLTERPRAVAPFGERLAVLYSNGTWSLVSAISQVSGPAAPEGLKFVSMIDAVDHLTFLARPKGDGDGLFLIDFDGSGLSEPRRAKTLGESSFGEPRLALAGPGAAFIVEHEVADDFEDVALSSDGKLQVFRGEKRVTLVGDGRDTSVELPPAALAGRLSVSRDADGSARFWWLADEQVVSQAFAMDGTARDEPTTVVVRPPPSPPLFERALYVVGAATLLLVLLAGGRQTIAVTRALAAKAPPQPAPLARRFAAGVIDCIPLAATAAYLIAGGKLTIFAGMLKFDSHRSEAILAAGVLLYLTLLISTELKWQQSIGKMIFALRVVSIQGEAPSVRAILSRNVLRLVDLNLITLLIVPVTPLRQRLGDFLAGTMIVDTLTSPSQGRSNVTPSDPADTK